MKTRRNANDDDDDDDITNKYSTQEDRLKGNNS